MKSEYNFSKSVKNPHAKHLKKQVTLRLGVDVIQYFKNLSEETGVPYQNLINLYIAGLCSFTEKAAIELGFKINCGQNHAFHSDGNSAALHCHR